MLLRASEVTLKIAFMCFAVLRTQICMSLGCFDASARISEHLPRKFALASSNSFRCKGLAIGLIEGRASLGLSGRPPPMEWAPCSGDASCCLSSPPLCGEEAGNRVGQQHCVTGRTGPAGRRAHGQRQVRGLKRLCLVQV
jgi:hypothetical protein